MDGRAGWALVHGGPTALWAQCRLGQLLVIAGVLSVVGLLGALALAGPRWGRTSVTVQARALSLVLTMDISRSMLAEDVSPTRLEAAAFAASFYRLAGVPGTPAGS